MIEFRAAADVPIALVDLDHFAGVTGDAAVGKEIGRVGKDGVEPAVGIFGGDGVEEFQAIALIEPEAAGVIAKD